MVVVGLSALVKETIKSYEALQKKLWASERSEIWTRPRLLRRQPPSIFDEEWGPGAPAFPVDHDPIEELVAAEKKELAAYKRKANAALRSEITKDEAGALLRPLLLLYHGLGFKTRADDPFSPTLRHLHDDFEGAVEELLFALAWEPSDGERILADVSRGLDAYVKAVKAIDVSLRFRKQYGFVSPELIKWNGGASKRQIQPITAESWLSGVVEDYESELARVEWIPKLQKSLARELAHQPAPGTYTLRPRIRELRGYAGSISGIWSRVEGMNLTSGHGVEKLRAVEKKLHVLCLTTIPGLLDIGLTIETRVKPRLQEVGLSLVETLFRKRLWER